MLFREIKGSYCENYKKDINAMCAKTHFLMSQMMVLLLTMGL